MKYFSLLLLIGAAAVGACSTIANNGNNANIRGTNTNTAYIANSETNAKPSMPVNATNISPPSMNKMMGTSNTNHNLAMNSNANGMRK